MTTTVYSWKPGDPDINLGVSLKEENEKLQAANNLLRVKIALLKHETSWKDNPDKMGGSFSQWEIENATSWR